jgi:hypothetical protein
VRTTFMEGGSQVLASVSRVMAVRQSTNIDPNFTRLYVVLCLSFCDFIHSFFVPNLVVCNVGSLLPRPGLVLRYTQAPSPPYQSAPSPDFGF